MKSIRKILLLSLSSGIDDKIFGSMSLMERTERIGPVDQDPEIPL